MSNPFLEERLSVDVRYGATYRDAFAVDITETSSGQEYRRLINPIPKRFFNIGYVTTSDDIGARVLNLYYRSFGKYSGFRVKNLDDYTSNGYIDTPTAFDQTLEVITSGSIYRLQKKYGTDQNGISIGYPTRTIFKPVSGTVKVGIVNNSNNFEQTITTHWTVDTTTGIVTFAANKTKSITGITTGTTTLISFGSAHTFAVNDSVHFSGIVGTTQLNNKRGLVTAINTGGDNITVAINSTGYTAWSSGGTVNTRPNSGDTVKGGFEFDCMARFNTDVEIEATDKDIRSANAIELVELITP